MEHAPLTAETTAPNKSTPTVMRAIWPDTPVPIPPGESRRGPFVFAPDPLPTDPEIMELAGDYGLVFRGPAYWRAYLREDGICEGLSETLPGEQLAGHTILEARRIQEALGITKAAT